MKMDVQCSREQNDGDLLEEGDVAEGSFPLFSLDLLQVQRSGPRELCGTLFPSIAGDSINSFASLSH